MGEASVAVLSSGGLDSCALIGDLARTRTVYPIYIRQGLAWESVELYWLRKFLSVCCHPEAATAEGSRRGHGKILRFAQNDRKIMPLQILDLPMNDVYGSHWSVNGKKIPGAKSPDSAVYLPGRNPILIVKSAVYCALHKIPAIAIGSLDHNPFPDATPGFFRAYSRALCMGLGRHIRIETPYRAMSKVEVIKRGKDLPLELSFSCLAPVGKKHCGKCNKCAERRKAFRVAGLPDRTPYAAGPLARAERGRGRG